MKLQEQISRIKSMMGLLNEDINPNNLKFGDKEPQDMVDGPIHKLQQELINLGLLKNSQGVVLSKPTGYFGPLTQNALNSYNNKNVTTTSKTDDKTITNPKNDDEITTNTNGDVVFVGGLESKMGLNDQFKLFKDGLNSQNAVSFHHTDVSSVLNYLKNNTPKAVVMFSAGCYMADKVANSGEIPKSKIFCIEPYAAKGGNSNVTNAVNNGVPSQNIFVGPSPERGKGVVPDTTSSNAGGHFDALTIVGSRIKNKI